MESDLRREELLRQRIERREENPEIKKELPAPPPAPADGPKTLIKTIKVTGAILLHDAVLFSITYPYENKELSLADLQKIADLITDAYRKKGYITSRAYLPQQDIVGGVLEIRVIEGVTGKLEVKGNRHFKTKLLRDKIRLQEGDPFNYTRLREGLVRINRQPDRYARTAIMPGATPASTDVVVEVKDRLPLHAGVEWDNFGSRYIDRQRVRTTLTHNNLLGREDILTLQYQASQGNHYQMISLRYLFPVTETLKVGLLAARTTLSLGRELKDLNARGKSRFYSLYATQSLIDTENLTLDLNVGFDYKDIFNFQLGNETSRDRLRNARIGLDLDVADRFGRTLITDELIYGIPGILGGLKGQDSRASRSGAGGKFISQNLALIRLQRLPYDSTLLWKNQLQLSPYILPAAEQFQLGGIANVRGYPPAESSGDRGFTMTGEWAFPLYFLPRQAGVPYSKAKLYDALRCMIFYDWGNTRLRRPQAGEGKTRTLRSAGWGLTFNLPEELFARLLFAWPLANAPSDGGHLHIWTAITKNF